MKIGLAQTRFPQSAEDGLALVKQNIKKASLEQCELVCFPESIIPGLRGVGYEVEPYNHEFQQAAIDEVCELARQERIAVILPMEWQDELGLHLAAFVIDDQGEVIGCQIKNQIDPGEDFFGYVPGKERQLFEINQTKFGIVICHEGWRYPETVRWAAVRGASIVFHPQFTPEVSNPEFYNYAMVGRSTENNIFFASVNYALKGQKSASALTSPTGEFLCAAPFEVETMLVHEFDPAQASRLLARRFRADLI
ncbi:carbon-nitrogen hydrolase family protein [Paenibacillus sp. BC26]|uniref:carbon-nitrogen hydrolase family protein n=1 Tax=Paenibacillus sp. BC26 TaxID=1881032 RepID=UPI0008F35E16|nr:carbon-nitrogen hydrolase family protein [Paenibacillus sp. BC26]SFS66992.1 ribosomal-protein-alanine N-acetyltransferase [Paenibacillus sp. BC26]